MTRRYSRVSNFFCVLDHFVKMFYLVGFCFVFGTLPAFGLACGGCSNHGGGRCRIS